jgi:hypothetical protein
MSPPPGNDDKLRRLINKARHLALTPQHRQLIADMREESRRKTAEACHDQLPTPSTPPEEFIEVLRFPEGDQRHLTVIIDGNHIGLVLNPRGEADPQRETELWNWLLERVRQEAHP